jgi:dUTP pyrophosphatase
LNKVFLFVVLQSKESAIIRIPFFSSKSLATTTTSTLLFFSSCSNNNHNNISNNIQNRTMSSSSSSMATLRVKRLSDNAVLPVRGSEWAAGYDLSASQAKTIPPGGRAVVPTDLSIACPAGTYGRVAPRSGLTVKQGIHVGAGVIDADYRGPVGVVLFNLGDQPFEVQPGDRIAQLILESIVMAPVEEVEELDDTVRGDGGFGSTGVSSMESSIKKKARTTATSGSPDARAEGAGDANNISPAQSMEQDEP